MQLHKDRVLKGGTYLDILRFLQLTIFFCSESLLQQRTNVAQENGARAIYLSILTGTTKLRFSPIYNSVVFYLINPKVAVDVPAYQRRLHTKFEKKIA